ncbi:MAG: VanZ family protein [Lachnospiraceae bacterium]|nr:VanZ family protein [Lachnospiraceae bacterium]
MVYLLSVGIECLSTLIFIIPAILILNHTLFKQNNLNKVIMVFVFAFYCMAVFSITGISSYNTIRIDFSFNLIPLADIINNPAGYIINTILNIILFMPMGFLVPSIWTEYHSLKKTIFMGFAVSVIIEILQIFTFRLTDIDDLITNTFGTFLGYYIGKLFSFKLPLKISGNFENTFIKYEPVIILIIVLLVKFFLKPLLSDTIWDIVLSGQLWESIK